MRPFLLSASLVLAGALGGVLGASEEAHACRCITAYDPPSAILASGAVVARGALTPVASADARLVRYRFTVEAALNADLPATIEVLTPSSGAACRAYFDDESDVVLILSEERPDGFFVTGCGQIAVDKQRAAWDALFDDADR